MFKKLFILILLSFCVPCFAKQSQPVIENYTFNGYELRLVKRESDLVNELTIKKDGKVIEEKINELSQKFTLRQGYEVTEVTPKHKLNSPILIFEDDTGERFSGFSRYFTFIFFLGDEFKILANFSGSEKPVIKKLPNKDEFEIINKDYELAYIWTKYPDTYNGNDRPELIYSLINGRYTVDPSKMKRAPLSDGELQKIVEVINRLDYKNYFEEEVREGKLILMHHFKYVDSPYVPADKFNTPTSLYFRNLLTPLLRLIYSGNCKQAHEVIDKTWPGTAKEKAKFLSDLKKRLAEEFKNDSVFYLSVIKKL